MPESSPQFQMAPMISGHWVSQFIGDSTHREWVEP